MESLKARDSHSNGDGHECELNSVKLVDTTLPSIEHPVGAPTHCAGFEVSSVRGSNLNDDDIAGPHAVAEYVCAWMLGSIEMEEPGGSPRRGAEAIHEALVCTMTHT